MFPPLACTVRGCGAPLQLRSGTLACPHAHTFDRSRAGYINLLQPQDRKSLDAGDSREAVEARAGLLARGIGAAVIDAVVARAAALLDPASAAAVVELGSGSGETLAALAARTPIVGTGIDLSVHAATHAARRHPSLWWVVANADRRLPLLDGSTALVISVHARRNPDECRRVLAPSGHLLVAVPAADDLIELRAQVQGEAVERDRVEALVAEHAAHFELVDRSTVRQTLELERNDLLALLRGTYRGARASHLAQVEALERLSMTLASDVVTFRTRT